MSARDGTAIQATAGLMEAPVAHPRPQAFNIVTGQLAHAIVGELAELSRTVRADELMDFVGLRANQIARFGSFGSRTRAARVRITSVAGVYLRCFLPPGSWSLEGAEVGIGDGCVDLVWRTPDGRTVFDELKTGGGRGYPDESGPAGEQTARYSRAGVEAHGPDFAGVRLLLANAPRHSLLVGPGPRLQRLDRTEFWFGTTGEVAK